MPEPVTVISVESKLVVASLEVNFNAMLVSFVVAPFDIPLVDSIDEFYNHEVKPHLPESWMDRSKDRIGYEINFKKYFYQYQPLRPLEDITKDLLELDKKSQRSWKEILK